MGINMEKAKRVTAGSPLRQGKIHEPQIEKMNAPEFPEFTLSNVFKSWKWVALSGLLSFVIFWLFALIPFRIEFFGFPITPKSMIELSAKKALVDQLGNSATSRAQQSKVLIAWADGLARGSKDPNVLSTGNYAQFMKQVQIAVNDARVSLEIYNNLLEDVKNEQENIVVGGV